MRLYYEAYEVLPEDSAEEPDFVRIDVTDLSESERLDALEAIREQFAGKKYVIYLHKCYHDEDPKKPCEVVKIEDRSS